MQGNRWLSKFLWLFTTTLVSTAQPKNIIDNIQWIEEPLNEELLKEVQAILALASRLGWANS